MPRSDYDDEFFWPAIGGVGSLHDLDHQEPLPRLYGLKSVSRAAAFALQDRPHRSQRRAGFVRTRD